MHGKLEVCGADFAVLTSAGSGFEVGSLMMQLCEWQQSYFRSFLSAYASEGSGACWSKTAGSPRQ